MVYEFHCLLCELWDGHHLSRTEPYPVHIQIMLDRAHSLTQKFLHKNAFAMK